MVNYRIKENFVYVPLYDEDFPLKWYNVQKRVFGLFWKTIRNEYKNGVYLKEPDFSSYEQALFYKKMFEKDELGED